MAHTGDLGSIDDDGFVSIVGRKKDLIITAGGKNVSPCEMEASIMTSPVVSQCVMIGDRKPFIAAIISLDLAETNLWLESKGAEQVADLDEASKNPIVRAEVERAVTKPMSSPHVPNQSASSKSFPTSSLRRTVWTRRA